MARTDLADAPSQVGGGCGERGGCSGWNQLRLSALIQNVRFYCLLLALLTCSLTCLGAEGRRSVTVEWNPSEGVGVTDYIVYYGSRSGVYSRTKRSHGKTSVKIGGLKQGATNYFVVTALDWNRLESEPSTEVVFQVGGTPRTGETPVIEGIPLTRTYIDATPISIPFTVADSDTPLEELTVTASSSESDVLPISNIVFHGEGRNRALTVSPLPGRGGVVIVTLEVSDQEHTNSTAFELVVAPFLWPVSRLTVNLRGNGYLRPDLSGQELNIGQEYKLTARPSRGHLFLGWTGSVATLSAKVQFMMRPELELDAVFIPIPFLPVEGSYVGLLREEGTPLPHGRRGLFTVRTTRRGTFSGKLNFSGQSSSFSGALDLDLNATITVSRPDRPPLEMSLSFGDDEHSAQVVGQVGDGRWVASLKGHRSVYSRQKNPAPIAGSYTIILPGQDDPAVGPEGDGFGRLKVDANGNASFVGWLADGSRVSQRVPLSRHGEWPFHVSLYKNAGLIHGWLTVTNGSADDVSGIVEWSRPSMAKAKHYAAGFTTEAFTTGSTYMKPPSRDIPVLNLTDGVVEFSRGDLEAPFTNTFSLTSNSKILNTSTNSFSMRLTLSSGLFTGNAVDPLSGNKLRFKGALLQDRNGGFGFGLGKTGSARIVIRP